MPSLPKQTRNAERSKMGVFAVHLSDDSVEKAAQRLREAYPEPAHHEVSERFFLVRAEGISRNVAEKLGFTSVDKVAGSVFKLNAAYAGWDRRAMWEWMALGEEE